MATKRIIKSILALFIILFITLSVYLMYVIDAYGTRWFSSPYNTRVQNRRDNIIAGKILDRNGVLLASSDAEGNRVYRKDKTARLSTALVVGDDYGQALGAESFFASYLLGFDQGALDMLSDTISGSAKRGSDIRLTIDATLCEYAYKALDGQSGAVLLMNYKTGEILASVSAPAYDPNLVAEYLSGEIEPENGSMVNRATAGQYAPGSVFKIITTIAALRNIEGIENMTFNCTGGLVFDFETGNFLGDTDSVNLDELDRKYSLLVDYQNGEHGEISFKQAFTGSCNVTFGRIAMMLGDQNLYRTAASLGLNDNYLFSDITATAGRIEHSSRNVDTAWAGVGQHKDIMTPINMCMITAAIANDGTMMEPKLLRMATTQQKKVTFTLSPSIYKQALSESESATLRDYMKGVVESGTGTSARISGYDVGGKTGTAEVTVDGENLSHAWFTGFIDSEDHPLAICVVVEFGGSGGKVAAPIARDILKRALNLGY